MVVGIPLGMLGLTFAGDDLPALGLALGLPECVGDGRDVGIVVVLGLGIAGRSDDRCDRK